MKHWSFYHPQSPPRIEVASQGDHSAVLSKVSSPKLPTARPQPDRSVGSNESDHVIRAVFVAPGSTAMLAATAESFHEAAIVTVHSRTPTGETGHTISFKPLRDLAGRFVLIELHSRHFGSRIAFLAM